jgi:pyridoxamine 5'-phosphate oxidase
MIEFCNNNQLKPFQLFRTYYGDAIKYGQKNADAISIASFSKNDSILDSRFVNLKILDNEEFIFFSSYDSPKAKQFDTFNQIAANLFWESINVQVRIKGKIKKNHLLSILYISQQEI